MEQIRFSIPEVLSLFGVIQCVYVLVYMLLRSGRLSRAGLPIAYFFILGLAFFFDFAESRLALFYQQYFYFQWAAWFLGPPLSVLLVVQIAQIYKTPALKHYHVLALIPLAFALSALLTHRLPGCEGFSPCEEMQSGLTLAGLLAGALSFLSLWIDRGFLSGIEDRERTGRERYWLVLSIIFANIAFLAVTLVGLGVHADPAKFKIVRTVLGLGFVYLVGTSLFRIYPPAVVLTGGKDMKLSAEEMEIAKKVEKLLTQDKVYHEPSYARTDLARECQTSEAVVSKVINVHFQKSFPQIISEYRVQDAKRMLEQTEANIKIIAAEVGFNSVASFNRVFRQIAGESPSAYRGKIRP